MPQRRYPLCSGCRRRWRHQPKACEARPRRFLCCSRCCLCSDLWVLQEPRRHGQVLHDVLIPSAGICQTKPSDGSEFSDLAVIVHNVTVRVFSSSQPYTLNPTESATLNVLRLVLPLRELAQVPLQRVQQVLRCTILLYRVQSMSISTPCSGGTCRSTKTCASRPK